MIKQNEKNKITALLSFLSFCTFFKLQAIEKLNTAILTNHAIVAVFEHFRKFGHFVYFLSNVSYFSQINF